MRKSILLLFVASLLPRVMLSMLRVTYGPSLFIIPDGFNDFGGIYLPQLKLLSQGFLPYKDFGYWYTPLFLYAMYPLYSLVGGIVAFIPIVLADAATAIVVYLIVGKNAGEKIGIAAGIAYALSPFALAYEDYLWLSSQPAVFFALMSIYLLQSRKPLLSGVALGVGVLFKQDALFIMPAYLFYYVREYGRQAWKGIAAMVTVLLTFSAPFLLSFPQAYIASISYGLLGSWVPILSRGLTLCSSFMQVSSGVYATCTNGTSQFSIFATLSSQFVSSVAPSATPGYGEAILTQVILTQLGRLLVIPVAVLILPAILAFRHKRNFLELAAAYSASSFLVVFSFLVHLELMYYLLGVYSLLLTAVTSRKTLTIAIVTPILALLTPSGWFQTLLPYLSLLAIMATQDLETGDSTQQISCLESKSPATLSKSEEVRRPEMQFQAQRLALPSELLQELQNDGGERVKWIQELDSDSTIVI